MSSCTTLNIFFYFDAPGDECFHCFIVVFDFIGTRKWAGICYNKNTNEERIVQFYLLLTINWRLRWRCLTSGISFLVEE